jgi:hypothetical protein
MIQKQGGIYSNWGYPGGMIPSSPPLFVAPVLHNSATKYPIFSYQPLDMAVLFLEKVMN